MGIGFRKPSDAFQSAAEVLAAKEVGEDKPVTEGSGLNWKRDCSSDPEPGDVNSVLENRIKRTPKVCQNAGEVAEEEKGQPSPGDVAAPLGISPTKKDRPNKKQLLLAEAARKESQNISRFFSSPKPEPKDLAEDLNGCLGQLPQFSSQSVCEEKAESQESEMVPKESGLSQGEEQKSEKTREDVTVKSCSSRIEPSCPELPRGKAR